MILSSGFFTVHGLVTISTIKLLFNDFIESGKIKWVAEIPQDSPVTRAYLLPKSLAIILWCGNKRNKTYSRLALMTTFNIVQFMDYK